MEWAIKQKITSVTILDKEYDIKTTTLSIKFKKFKRITQLKYIN